MTIRSIGNLGVLSLSLAVLVACGAKGDGDTDDSATGTTAGVDSTGESDSTTGGSGSTTGDATTGDSDPTTGATTEEPTDSTDGENTGGGSACIDTPTVLGLDEATPLGATAAEILADKLGERMTTLTFMTEPTSLSDAWKGKQLPLTVTLRHEGGEIRWVDSEPDPEWTGEGDEGFPGECQDRLEIDVELDFVTAEGELDEHPKAVLRAVTAERAELMVDLIPPGLGGSLDLETLYKPDEMFPTVVRNVTIAGTWQGNLAGGVVLHEIQIGSDENGIVGFGPLASWGDVIEPIDP
ncbi:MAG TPA: hypothetical protein VIK91_19770 [Nannocystis sp.]